MGPLFAVAMYGWLSEFGRGDLVFAICVAFNVAGALGFAWLARRQKVLSTEYESIC